MTARPLTGWGRTAPTAAEVVSAADAGAVRRALVSPGDRGTIPRGLGRSYGDAAQNAGGTVVDMTAMRSAIDLDASAGLVRVGGGISLEAVMAAAVPAGWFVPVSPGTRHVTVGGAIAADIHGKNHHWDGTFASHVRSVTLATAGGELVELDPQTTPGAFWATAGGLGLTGAVVEAVISLRPIESSLLRVDTDRVPDLDAALAHLADGATRHRYSVAWIDLCARGRALGRSVVTQGDFAPRSDAPPTDPLAYRPRRPIPTVPAPSGLLNPLTVRAFNEVWYRKAPRRRRGELQRIPTFFHPLDIFSDWNQLYGPRGFVQWQCLVPFGAEDVLRHCIEDLVRHRAPSFLAVLKTLGAADEGPLSFPAPGWTLAIDLPAGDPTLAGVLDLLDEAVVGCGGRLYLAKDSRTRPELIPAMYPRLDEWRAQRDALDPERKLVSDLARRLDLLGDR